MRKIITLSLLLALSHSSFSQDTRLLRFPTIYGNQIVFSYAGDLYTVSSAGGTARKLTNDVGTEIFPRFSPDGKSIAFTGQYDGNTEVYLMPAEGGIPTRLTYTATLTRDDVSDRMGPNNIVMTWKDDKTIVYRSRMFERNDLIGRLFYASVDGGIPQQLPLPRGGFCSFSPDKKKLAYNRVFHEFRTWKHYRGGQADDIWIYDFDTKQTTNITNNPGQDIIPMWSGNKIYFASDRDFRMNLFVYDLTTKETKKLTNFTEFDVKFPSLGDNAIVFENGGYIYKMDMSSEKAEKVSISIKEDFDTGRGGWKDVSKEVTNFEISPDGNRGLFGARGDVFTVPLKNGNTRNITGTSGVHERSSKWSPDGKWIAFISDASGEDEIYIKPEDSNATPTRLTQTGDTYKFQIAWSPDSRKIAWADRKLRLQYVDIDTKKITDVATAKVSEFTDYTWSPDSKWIAYSHNEEKQMTTAYLYSTEAAKSTAVTDGWFDSYNLTFSSDGKYLFFVSDRSFNPTYGETEFNHTYTNMSGIFLLTLSRDTKSPFVPKSDEVKIGEKPAEKKPEVPGAKNTDKSDAKNSTGTWTVNPPQSATRSTRVDLDGIQQRITALPIAAGRYRNLQSVGDKIFYVRNNQGQERPALVVYDLDKQKETELGEFGNFEISADGKKMMVSDRGNYSIIDLPNSKIDAKEKLNLSDMKVQLDRKAEWNQIFNECWRQMRDFLYDPHLHGVDWKKMRDTYGQLLPYVNHRTDLTYIIGEMIGELNIGHAYVGGGDYPKPERIETGLLGAKLERDPASKFYRITKILKGQNWDRTLRSPLTEIGVNAKEGEYIIAVDGKSTNDMKDIYESWVGKAGKQVTLKLNSSPQVAGSHETVVVMIGEERSLYYYNWVQTNIEKVNQATGGKVGYLHIPDMGVGGLNEFSKYFYPQTSKDAMIVDVRGNGGGNVSPMIIERLGRQAAMISVTRNMSPAPDPASTILGPKVMMIDEFAGSDGDIVGYRFRKYGIGKLIGKRTWGGVVGIRGSLPLLDGGFLNRPEFSRYDTEGKEWIMEGHGVDPDIFVDNDPAHEFNGIDDQLNKTIEFILEELKKNPPKLSPPPAYPDKNR